MHGQGRRGRTRARAGRPSLARRTLGALHRCQGLNRPAGRVATQNYYDDGSGRSPRYYELVDINRMVEAITRGQNRPLLMVVRSGSIVTYDRKPKPDNTSDW